MDKALRKKYAKKILRKLTRQMRENLTPDSLVILRDEDFTHASPIELKPGDIIICNLIPGLESPPFIEVVEHCLELTDQVKSFPAKPEPRNPMEKTQQNNHPPDVNCWPKRNNLHNPKTQTNGRNATTSTSPKRNLMAETQQSP